MEFHWFQEKLRKVLGRPENMPWVVNMTGVEDREQGDT